MKIWPLLFNIISLQGNALNPSLFKLFYPFKIEGPFSGPLSNVYGLYVDFIASIPYTMKMGFQFWERIEVRRSHNRRIWGMRKDFKSTFGRSSHGNLWRVSRGVVLQEQNTASQFLRFPDVAASIRLYNMNCLLCNLAHDNQSWIPIDYPKRLRSSPSLLNEPLEGVSQGASIVCSAFLNLDQSGEPMSHLGLQLARQIARIIFIAIHEIPRNMEPSPFLIIGQHLRHPSCLNLWHT